MIIIIIINSLNDAVFNNYNYYYHYNNIISRK